MSLISKITGTLINQLGGGSSAPAGTSAPVSGGSIGRSVGQSSKLSLSKISQSGVLAFSRSAMRINSAIGYVNITQDTLKGLLEVTDDLISISEQASAISTGSSTRTALNRRFEGLIDKFNKIRETAQKDGFDLLDKEDLTTILKQAGIDDRDVSTLVNALDKLGGKNGLLGVDVLPKEQKSARTTSSTTTTYTVNIGGGGNGTFTADAAPGYAYNNPLQSASLDMNKDGLADLVTVNLTGDSVSLSFGNGDGTFNAPTSYATALIGAQSIAVGDLNRDGFSDVVVGTSTGAGFTVFTGDGAGFASVNTYALPYPTNISNVHLADLNRDGILDLAGSSSSELSIAFGNSDGSFTVATSYARALGAKNDLIIGDLNGDGVQDISVSDEDDGKTFIFLGNSNGTFKEPVSYSGGGRAEAVGDVDNDGNLDLFVGVLNSVSLLRGNGDGTFKSPVTFTISGRARDLQLTDLNGDGRLDIAVSNDNNFKVDIFVGNGNGTFNAAVSYYSGVLGQRMAITDFDRDGDLDLAVPNKNGPASGISILLGNGGGGGSGTFNARKSFNVGTDPVDVTYADLNQDGNLDVITAGQLDDKLTVLLGNGYGTFKSPLTVSTGDSPSAVRVTDVNLDGIPDLISTGKNDSSVSVAIGNGDGTFLARLSFVTLSSPISAEAADVNRDGEYDIVTMNKNGTIGILLGNKNDGSFSAVVSFQSGGSSGSSSTQGTLQIFDANGDGIQDIATKTSNDSTVSIFLGNSDGSFKAPVTYVNDASHVLKAVDVNRDGVMDLVGMGTDISNNYVSVMLGNSNGSFQAGVVYDGFGTGNGKQISSGDFNSDGKADLIVSMDNNEVRLSLGNGDGTFKASTSFTSGTGTGNLIAADINRDGSLDIGVISKTDARFSLFLGNGNGSFGATTTSVTQTETREKTTTAIGPIFDNPTIGRSTKNRAEALLSLSLLNKIHQQIEDDLKNVSTILSELQGGSIFAQAGTIIFNRLPGSIFSSDPDQIALDVVQGIKSLSRDRSLDSHSSIDAQLAKDLLAD